MACYSFFQDSVARVMIAWYDASENPKKNENNLDTYIASKHFGVVNFQTAFKHVFKPRLIKKRQKFR